MAEAARRGFELEPDAGRLLAERVGDSTARLGAELDRLALWADPGGLVSVEDLESMVADTSEEVAWALSDAIVARDAATALDAAERLAGQGEAVTPMIRQVAKRLREANSALEQLEAGKASGEVEAALAMHPYAAKMLLRKLRGRNRSRDASRHLRDRRPRVVDARRVGLPRAGGADAGRAPRRRGVIERRQAEARIRAARAFLRAPLLRCRAPRWTAESIREQSSRWAASATSESPPDTAVSSRWKYVFTELVMRRFSSCSRSVRALRFFCEAMLAISRRRTIAVVFP